MKFDDYVQRVRSLTDDDPYLGLLKFKLASGFEVQSVGVRGDRREAFRYVFVLTRLGTRRVIGCNDTGLPSHGLAIPARRDLATR